MESLGNVLYFPQPEEYRALQPNLIVHLVPVFICFPAMTNARLSWYFRDIYIYVLRKPSTNQLLFLEKLCLLVVSWMTADLTCLDPKIQNPDQTNSARKNDALMGASC